MAQHPFKTKTRMSGFTLIELALVITILGFAVAAMTISFTHFSNEYKARITRDRMGRVLNALSLYAQRYYRLPCGADPAAAGVNAGTEPNNGRCFNRNAATDNNLEAMGVVPWKVLGLSEDDARDGWGRYFTYKPAPHLTLDNTSANMSAASSETADDVHDACRNGNWYNSSGAHVNPAKALFCCNAAPKPQYLTRLGADNANPNDISQWNETFVTPTDYLGTITTAPYASTISKPVAGSNRWIEDRSSGRTGDFSEIQSTTSGRPESTLGRATGIAVSLISHGPNGKLSFIKGQAKSTRNTGTFDAATGGVTANLAGGADLEILNALQASGGSIENPKTAINDQLGGASLLDVTGQKDNASDDITSVIFTDQLMARVGGNTCLKLANIETANIGPFNGACGTAHLTMSATAPTTNLCAVGGPSTVTGSGPWQWDCSGINGGSSQSCITFKTGGGGCNLGPIEIIADFTGVPATVPTAPTCLTATYTTAPGNLAATCPNEATVPVGGASAAGACLNEIQINGTTTKCEVYGRACQ